MLKDDQSFLLQHFRHNGYEDTKSQHSRKQFLHSKAQELTTILFNSYKPRGVVHYHVQLKTSLAEIMYRIDLIFIRALIT